MSYTYDYIIVGGGTAGSVLASRLSAGLPQCSILLIEAGPDGDPRIEPALGLIATGASEIEWNHFTVPQAGVEGMVVPQVQGKVRGGSTAINVQGWTRGPAVDYDQWAEDVGDQRWSWKGMLPYFKRTETFYPAKAMDGMDLSRGHGFDGPVKVAHKDNSGRPRNYPLRNMVRRAYESVGLEKKQDSASGDVIGFWESAASTYDGKRQCASECYKIGENVTTWTESCAEKILFEGKKAVGVQVHRNVADIKQGPVKATAMKEVLICSGVQGSAKLLLLSGIGPREELAKHGIPQTCDLPVGENYSDHGMWYTLWKLRDRGLSFGDMLMVTEECDWTAGLPSDWMALHRHDDSDVRTLASKILDPSAQDKLMARGKAHTESFVLYGHFDLARTGEPNPGGSCIMIANVLVSPTSRGTVKVRSADFHDPPLLDPKFLSNDLDKTLLLKCGELTMSAMRGPVGKEYGVREYGIDESIRDDYSEEALWKRALKTFRSINHGGGSCAMGSVVDAECRVKGVENLRVVDSSVLPFAIGAHYQAIVYAVAEQMSDIILDGQKHRAIENAYICKVGSTLRRLTLTG